MYLLVAEYYSRKKNVKGPLQLKSEDEGFGKSQAQSIKMFSNSMNESGISRNAHLSESLPTSQA